MNDLLLINNFGKAENLKMPLKKVAQIQTKKQTNRYLYNRENIAYWEPVERLL